MLNTVQSYKVLLIEKKIYFVIFLYSGSFLEAVSQKTAGFLFTDLRALVQKSIFRNSERFFGQNPLVCPVFAKSFKLNFDDFEKSLKHFDDIMASTIGAPKIPTVSWQDVG
jgi:SpoVK/Ycf46/Vps4 family AAA+-type ATPase